MARRLSAAQLDDGGDKDMETRLLITLSLLPVICMLSLGVGVHAETRQAASCSRSDVLNAIGSAQDGDTVALPAGDCAWSSGIQVTKDVTISGAGIDNTTISYPGVIIDFVGGTSEHDSRITGFTFKGIVKFSRPSQGWFRLDHCKIVRSDEPAGTWDNHIWGADRILIDHNHFIHDGNSDVRFFIFDGEEGADPQLWREGSSVGKFNNVFIEDNLIENLNVRSGNEMFFQVWWAGKVVLRHNIIRNFAIDIHDYRDSSQRAGRSWEIYDNQWPRDPGFDLEWINLRGGTGVVFNNTLTESSQTHGIQLMAYSAYGYVSACCCMDADHMYIMDGIGRGRFAGVKRPGDASLEADCMNRGAWSQELEPAYFWNNTRNGVSSEPSVDTGCGCSDVCGSSQCQTDAIRIGRDYFTSAKSGYAPYAYPHPRALDINASMCVPAQEICGNGIDEDCSGSDLSCACVHPADSPPCDSCISMSELQVHIGQWRSGSVKLSSMMEAISIWKQGC
jgi:hypothetical protein